MTATAHAFLNASHPIAFAHRGAHEGGEENTPAAFARAVELGYRYIETDVQASRDGVAVVFHDDTLERVMGAEGRIGDHGWDELSRLTTPGGERLMRLDDLLAAFPDTFFNLDAKVEASVEPMAEAIRRCGAVERVCIGSFDVRRTRRVLGLLGGRACWSPSHGGVARLWLAGFGVGSPTLPFPVVQVPTHFRGIPVVTRRFVEAAHASGIHVHVWTVDREEEMRRLLDLGVDGLMTDRPSLLRQVLESRGQWDGR
ncbi:glycerophosphodiester phosphodiesterase [Lutibaculum baratangense]|uniref:Glycerophosphoryl diester phosphodiesterase n=1 Tax=Lutibaculum baratangense AMV1 TaxID=631454 RepID=V4RKD3_9HYPH|nr:glycerophosphodiester phosphodiesterase [Lutibaculum baratangense]ESR23715.1 Glycerophosphoryl diester phosphodiesterase [Lutibaculum baratangense AMV1]